MHVTFRDQFDITVLSAWPMFVGNLARFLPKGDT